MTNPTPCRQIPASYRVTHATPHGGSGVEVAGPDPHVPQQVEERPVLLDAEQHQALFDLLRDVRVGARDFDA